MISQRQIAIAFFVLALLLHSIATKAQPTNDDAPVYLFATFHEPEQDGLHFAFSYDGYFWSNVPGLFLKAHVDQNIMRDPSIARGADGTWHLV